MKYVNIHHLFDETENDKTKKAGIDGSLLADFGFAQDSPSKSQKNISLSVT